MIEQSRSLRLSSFRQRNFGWGLGPPDTLKMADKTSARALSISASVTPNCATGQGCGGWRRCAVSFGLAARDAGERPLDGPHHHWCRFLRPTNLKCASPAYLRGLSQWRAAQRQFGINKRSSGGAEHDHRGHPRSIECKFQTTIQPTKQWAEAGKVNRSRKTFFWGSTRLFR